MSLPEATFAPVSFQTFDDFEQPPEFAPAEDMLQVEPRPDVDNRLRRGGAIAALGLTATLVLTGCGRMPEQPTPTPSPTASSINPNKSTGVQGYHAGLVRKMIKSTSDSIQRGDHGKRVTYRQKWLKTVGCNPGAVDGWYGSDSINATIRLQVIKKLKPVDGIIGPDTDAALVLAYIGKSNGPGVKPEKFCGLKHQPTKASLEPKKIPVGCPDPAKHGNIVPGTIVRGTRCATDNLAKAEKIKGKNAMPMGCPGTKVNKHVPASYTAYCKAKPGRDACVVSKATRFQKCVGIFKEYDYGGAYRWVLKSTI